MGRPSDQTDSFVLEHNLSLGTVNSCFPDGKLRTPIGTVGVSEFRNSRSLTRIPSAMGGASDAGVTQGLDLQEEELLVRPLWRNHSTPAVAEIEMAHDTARRAHRVSLPFRTINKYGCPGRPVRKSSVGRSRPWRVRCRGALPRPGRAAAALGRADNPGAYTTSSRQVEVESWQAGTVGGEGPGPARCRRRGRCMNG